MISAFDLLIASSQSLADRHQISSANWQLATTELEVGNFRQFAVRNCTRPSARRHHSVGSIRSRLSETLEGILSKALH